MVLVALLLGLVFVGIFVLGMLFSLRLWNDAREDAMYERVKEEYYLACGFRHVGDPVPYVPPKSVVVSRRKTPRARRLLPGMSKLDRLMREGKRGTIMWRAGDRKKAD